MWEIVQNFISTDKDINVLRDKYYDDENLYKSTLLDKANGDMEVYRELESQSLYNNDKENFCELIMRSRECKVYVYIAKINDLYLYEQENIEETILNALENDKITKQKRAGYTLLKYAAKKQWGIDINLSNISVSENGKPYIEGFNFSISHSGGLVCVAISDSEIGVDLECSSKYHKWRSLQRRVLNPNEVVLDCNNETMTKIWTQKEAIFKLNGERVFSPNKIEVGDYCTSSFSNIYCDDNDYILSVATREQSANYLYVLSCVKSEGKFVLE